ncbi:MAG: collagen-like protein [Flavobacteriales bacterium]|nr:collagen-like protein [Flavobacteriales bacterium]
MMKRLFASTILKLAVVIAFAQSPEMFSYQGVARDNGGNILANQSIGLRLSILSGSIGGTVEYSESHAVSTNGFGMFNVSIGDGSVLSGSFAGINWGGNSHFVKVEMDPSGGTTYQAMGTSQLLSVPYALYADNSGTAGPTGPTGADGNDGADGATGPTGAANINGTANYVAKFTGANTGGNSQIYDNGTNVGVGTTSPTEKLEVNGDVAVSGSSRSLIAPDGAFNIESTTGVDVIIDNDDNSTNSSFKVKRNSDGSEIIFEAMENGNVEVEGEYAYVNSKTHYKSFSWGAFQSVFSATTNFGQPSFGANYGRFLDGGTALGYAISPLHLPDGAVVTELKAWLWDNDASSAVRLRLFVQPLGAETYSGFNTIESSSSTAMASVQELSTSPNLTIDNSNNIYFLWFAGKQNSDDTRFYGARVTYTVDQAD